MRDGRLSDGLSAPPERLDARNAFATRDINDQICSILQAIKSHEALHSQHAAYIEVLRKERQDDLSVLARILQEQIDAAERWRVLENQHVQLRQAAVGSHQSVHAQHRSVLESSDVEQIELDVVREEPAKADANIVELELYVLRHERIIAKCQGQLEELQKALAMLDRVHSDYRAGAEEMKNEHQMRLPEVVRTMQLQVEELRAEAASSQKPQDTLLELQSQLGRIYRAVRAQQHVLALLPQEFAALRLAIGTPGVDRLTTSNMDNGDVSLKDPWEARLAELRGALEDQLCGHKDWPPLNSTPPPEASPVRPWRQRPWPPCGPGAGATSRSMS